MDIKKKLLRKQKKLFDKLIENGPFIEGSLTECKRVCGTSSCRCRNGGDKHPTMFFTWKENRKTKSLYVPVAKWDEAKMLSDNYKKFKTIAKEISEIQKELLKLK